MKEKIFKNFSLKLLSAVFAVVLWTVIVNIYDPNTSYTFSNITVQLINTQSLTDKDYSYEVVDGGKISVTVSGPKSVVTDLKTSDISATADLSKVTAFTDYVDIQVQVIKDGQVLNNVEAVPRTSALKLSIENRDTKTLSLDVNTTGSTASGYTVASTSSSPTYIKVTGPTSLLESVAALSVNVDVSGAKEEYRSARHTW
jgi:YbbR domain-containing protein